MDRPKCGRCGRLLDLFCGEDGPEFMCNNPGLPLDDDNAFWARWDQLPGDDVVRLLKQIEGA